MHHPPLPPPSQLAVWELQKRYIYIYIYIYFVRSKKGKKERKLSYIILYILYYIKAKEEEEEGSPRRRRRHRGDMEVFDNHCLPSITINPIYIYLLVILLPPFLVLYSTVRCMNALPIHFPFSLSLSQQNLAFFSNQASTISLFYLNKTILN